MHEVIGALAAVARGESLPRQQLEHALHVVRKGLETPRARNPLTEADLRWMSARLVREIPGYDPKDICAELERVLDLVEDVRRRNSDPRHRASFVARFPHLYDVLCGHQLECGDVAAAFRTIESSKGRFVADSLGSSARFTIALDAFASRFGELSNRQASYLTALTGERDVYLVLVTTEGNATCQRVPIADLTPPAFTADRDGLTALVRKAQDLKWCAVREHLFGPLVDFRAQLKPLVAWLGDQDLEGHLVFSPDGPLYNVPLHGLDVGEHRLGELVSVSRAHGMQTLLAALETDGKRPAGFIGLFAPSEEDVTDVDRAEGKVRKLDAFSQVPRQLGELLSGKVLEGTDATVERFLSEPELDHRVIHFSAHGVSPFAAAGSSTAASPLDQAAILLATEQRLPRFDEFKKTSAPNRLTPRRVLESDVMLQGSHITMMCCVSGIVQEGPAGDALGLEWAFFLRGAASVLSTYWNIDVEKVAHFYAAFYDNWLDKSMTRARAFEASLRSLATETGDPDIDGFCLSGDWR